MHNISIKSEIRGYHVYKIKPSLGVKLLCHAETKNKCDKYAFKVTNDSGDTIRHVPARPQNINVLFSKLNEVCQDIKITW